ncbi:hypothetical protein [endosymbiont GvMRE of Glomus versiforme]|uniref:hypothetical protein n=1 Tax=endosymbiont GvMRE of Glomus versiforme TaxID=2039283 RepID=UPI000EEF1ADE|nr:hypothetical protein [endosymbiont GvMRE of Glomus versiforme]RHZ37199.1 hypothetical protein GvMRE_I1g480 [endosymbiont GvMRE of Glomus versiforme]
MGNYSNRDTIINLKGEILSLYRKIQNQMDNIGDWGSEAEMLRNDLILNIDQSMNEGLEPEDATELKEILQEVNDFRQSLGLWV